MKTKFSPSQMYDEELQFIAAHDVGAPGFIGVSPALGHLRGRILHQLNPKARDGTEGTLPSSLATPKTSPEEQGLQFSRVVLICRLEEGNKDIFESQLARQAGLPTEKVFQHRKQNSPQVFKPHYAFPRTNESLELYSS